MQPTDIPRLRGEGTARRPPFRRRSQPGRWTWLVLLLGTILLGSIGARAETSAAPQAGEVRLYLLEDPGCPYCARWTAEVQPGYLNSPEGAFAPLIRRYRSDPAVSRFQSVNYSPTFILVRGDEEIGRIVGYMGADLFWIQLDELLKKAGFKPPH